MQALLANVLLSDQAHGRGGESEERGSGAIACRAQARPAGRNHGAADQVLRSVQFTLISHQRRGSAGIPAARSAMRVPSQN